jgi:hypothetical protein
LQPQRWGNPLSTQQAWHAGCRRLCVN